ncbi:hypothetical protein JIG36_05570 [Actinoplanes sp. LDG1-06]|uniref:Uncharacterized protein n=1 Tax=Paractinoplanes ovalisporus TaxID=2810368 RepID=A0ABS2A5B3_9ACTN|nr:hypothetical protein [Actinoplanes ovalisporus]MBM2615027.1 hypothetical protein [Actinoplanes ovalisporus]
MNSIFSLLHPRADPYVNIIVHATQRFELRQIHFISIVEHDYKDEGGDRRAAAIAGATQDLLERLAAGNYLNHEQTEAISHEGAAVYQRCLDRLRFVKISSLGVRWADLGDTLKSFAKGSTALFDVTALKKNLLVDAVALILPQAHTDVWTFELLKAPTYGVDDLVHNLIEDRDYKYRRLTDSPHVKSARRRMLSASLTMRTLGVITAAVAIPVVIVQIFWPNSWLQATIAGVGSATSIAGWFFFMNHER